MIREAVQYPNVLETSEFIVEALALDFTYFQCA